MRAVKLGPVGLLRAATAVFAVVASLVGIRVGRAQGANPPAVVQVNPSPGKGGVTYRAGQGRGGTGASRGSSVATTTGAAGSLGASPSPSPSYWAQGLTVRHLATGYCIAPLYRSFSTKAAALAWQSSPGLHAIWLFAMRTLAGHFCPPTKVVSSTHPSASLVGKWIWSHGERLLPAPRPQIAPGYALCGNLAYLLDAGAWTKSFSVDLGGIGVLQMNATGLLYVNWGDGSTSGPYQPPGAPWPDGWITHVYEQPGSYNVTVVERWSVVWTGGGQRGVVSGLGTTASLAGFPVKEAVSLRIH